MSFATARGTEIRSEGRDLPSQIRALSRQVDAKDAQVRRLAADVEALSAERAPPPAELRALRARSGQRRPGGLTAVHGPAVTVSLTDASSPAPRHPPGFHPEDVVVHQQDVQAVVNALWRGGAEAMMIQDQRVIATSAVRCVGQHPHPPGPGLLPAVCHLRHRRPRPPPGRPSTPMAQCRHTGGMSRPWRPRLLGDGRPGPDHARVRCPGVGDQGHGGAVTGFGADRAGRTAMRAVRTVVGVVGELLITAGLVIMLYVVWTLYWVGTIEGQTGRRRRRDGQQFALTAPPVAPPVVRRQPAPR